MPSAPAQTPVAIVGGTGALGFGLALRLAQAGTTLRIGSRDPTRAQEAAARVLERVPDARVSGHENGPATEGCEIVVLCVPFRSQSETMTNLRGHLQPGQILLDATVPLAAAVSGRATRTLGVWQGSAAQQAEEMAPEGVRIVSGLHTVSAALLSDLDHELDEDVLVCGNAKADKERVSELIERIPGLRSVDCGRLEMARFTEGLTPLIIGINTRYKTRAGIRITGLPPRP